MLGLGQGLAIPLSLIWGRPFHFHEPDVLVVAMLKSTLRIKDNVLHPLFTYKTLHTYPVKLYSSSPEPKN